MYSLGNLLRFVIMQNTIHLFDVHKRALKNETTKQQGLYFEKCKVKEVILPSTRCVTGH